MSTLFWGSTTLSAEPFNTAGQTFLPDHYDPETPDVITPRFRLTLQRLLDSSLLWGLAITLGTYPLKSEKALSMFTTSKDVMRLVAIGPILAVGALIAPMLTAEGTLLCGHQNFTARSHDGARTATFHAGTLVVLGEFQWLVTQYGLFLLRHLWVGDVATARW